MKTLYISVSDAHGACVVEQRFATFPISVGRHPSNHIAILDTRISRFHAELAIDGATVVVRDRGSGHGTTIVDRGMVWLLRNGSFESPGQAEFVVGAFRVVAKIEEGAGPALSPTLACTTSATANVLRNALGRRPSSGEAKAHFEYALEVLKALRETHAAISLAASYTPTPDVESACESDRRGDLSASLSALHALERSLLLLGHQGLSAGNNADAAPELLDRAHALDVQGGGATCLESAPQTVTSPRFSRQTQC